MNLKEKYTIDDLIAILKRLREPDGCPWDRVQTHQSIKKSMIEETYEAIDALDFGDDKAFANELGDVLLQVVFHSELADERGAFNFDDVVKEVCVKLITRHSHVFGDDKADNEAEALDNWEKNKKKEKQIASYTGVLSDVPKYLPALMRAEKVQKKAKKVGFDWPDMSGALDKLCEELVEFQEALDEKDPDHIEEEFGDLLFAAVNAARFAGVDPEKALHRSCVKFINRFRYLEDAARAEGRDLETMTLEEMDALYEEAKKR